MRIALTKLPLLVVVACGPHHHDGDNDGGGGADACMGLECQVDECAKRSLPPTTLTGAVYAPNGTLPLYGVNVYVPRDTPLPPFPEGVECSRCSDALPGAPIARTQTDEAGKFELKNVPAGDNIPLVVTIGKWRRQITIARVESCTVATVPVTDTRLPKNQSEGDIPKIAITTGRADALECLIRKIGIDDAEFTTSEGPSRIHLYKGNGAAMIGTTPLANATTLWNNFEHLKKYDLAMFSCEAGQNAGTKSQDAMNAVKAYADLGGRLFLSHWHNIWIEGATKPRVPADTTQPLQAPEVWPGIATFNDSETSFGGTADDYDLIDELSNPKGSAFADWMVNVMGSTVRGQIPIGEYSPGPSGKNTVQTIDNNKAERWVYWWKKPDGQGGFVNVPQNFQFTTPNEVAPQDRCGKVVFSDMHVSGDSISDPNKPFPMGCSSGPLTPQEKAPVFMFFDISSCVGPIF